MSEEEVWGLYPWFEEHGEYFIHPKDLLAFKELSPYGKVFVCIKENSKYLTLKYGDKTFRVNPCLFKQVNKPRFKIGSEVRLRNSEDIGIIEGIEWHYKNGMPFYLISINGKKKTKRYLDNDFR